MNQPHSGVPVPKRIVEQAQAVMTVQGGGVHIEIPHPDNTWGALLRAHNLVLGRGAGGKRAYVDAQPMPMAAGVAPPSNDLRGSWENYRRVSTPPRQGRQADGASSSQPLGPAPFTKKAPPQRYARCPACNFRQIVTVSGYCTNCRGRPWQCQAISPQGNVCNHWNFPWDTRCIVCFPEVWDDETGTWRAKRRALG